MIVTDSIILKSVNEDEYRIMLVEAPVRYLSDLVQVKILKASVDIIEIIIERVHGGKVTDQKLLHQISNWIAGCFADNPDMILFYQCDDINPIPSRNGHSSNSAISVQEYRSRLFSQLFNTYIRSHQIEGVFNYPIRIDGEGYSYFMHVIARKKHENVVKMIGFDILEGFGK